MSVFGAVGTGCKKCYILSCRINTTFKIMQGKSFNASFLDVKLGCLQTVRGSLLSKHQVIGCFSCGNENRLQELRYLALWE